MGRGKGGEPNPGYSSIYGIGKRRKSQQRRQKVKPEDDENQERAYYWSLSGHLPCTDPWCLCPARSGLWPGRQSLKLTVPVDGRGQGAGHSSMQPTISLELPPSPPPSPPLQ